MTLLDFGLGLKIYKASSLIVSVPDLVRTSVSELSFVITKVHTSTDTRHHYDNTMSGDNVLNAYNKSYCVEDNLEMTNKEII